MSPNSQCQSRLLKGFFWKNGMFYFMFLNNNNTTLLMLIALINLMLHKPLGFYGVIFAHSDCDTVCNLLCLFAMTMIIDCAIVSFSVATNKLLIEYCMMLLGSSVLIYTDFRVLNSRCPTVSQCSLVCWLMR